MVLFELIIGIVAIICILIVAIPFVILPIAAVFAALFLLYGIIKASYNDIKRAYDKKRSRQ